MVMDMDVLVESEPASRATSPPPPRPSGQTNGAIEEEAVDSDDARPDAAVNDKVSEEPPKKMGNLMKELKQDVTQGAMEFNMDSFF